MVPFDYQRRARSLPYPQQDVKGSGEWAVYFETDDPKVIHRWKTRTQTQALEEAKKAQKEHGGYVTIMNKGREVNEVGPGGKVKNATSLRVAARYVRSREFSSPDALKDYLREHPNADPRKHTVDKGDGSQGSGSARTKVKGDKGLAAEIGKLWKNKPGSGAVSKVQRMMEKGDAVSLNLLDQAVKALKSEERDASGDEKKALRKVRDALQSQMRE